MNNLILIGFKAAGKTTLGRLVASKLQKPFIDTDELFTEPPHTLYEKLGEEQFRKEEQAHLQTLTHLSGHVISTGGGVGCDLSQGPFLRGLGTVIHLHTPKEVIRERLLSSRVPLFLKGSNFDLLYHYRLGIYLEIAHHSIVTEDDLWAVIHLDPFSE